MTRQLQKADADAQDYIQFRGPQTSVTLETEGLPAVHFGTEHRHDLVAHRAYPVVDPGADVDDVPDDAVVRPVAEQIVEQSPLVCWGVACEVEDCDAVFDTPRGEASHYGSVHTDGDADETDQSVTDTEDDGGGD